MNKIYKAEIIDVYIPSATDKTVNIPPDQNRLYFKYTNTYGDPPETKTTIGYVIIQSGTYCSPSSIAKELSRQFDTVLKYAGFDTTQETIGIKVDYSSNLNRYIFRDKQIEVPGTLIIYPNNGYITSYLGNEVQNSMAELLMLPTLSDELVSGPRFIKSTVGDYLYPGDAEPGDYGAQTTNLPGYVPLNLDSIFSNCVLSNLVLTNCKIFLSLGKLNGDTCNLVQDESGKGNNVPPIFCQIPNNTSVSSSSVKTLLNQPNVFSAIQFYNPPISKLNTLNVTWYQETGELIRILEHCFTVRIYYFQKRSVYTGFSY